MTKKNITFFTQKNPTRYFFVIPLGLIIIASVGILIATGWFWIDFLIADELAQGLTTEFGKYWARFYEQLGNTELFVVLIIYLTILLETWFLTKIKQHTIKFKKHYWVVNSYYFTIIFIWLAINLINILVIPNQDTGFGPGIDYFLIASNKYQLTGMILAFTYQTVFLGIGLYYIRYRLVKTNRLLTEQYWVKAIKAISFLAITYVIIVILKMTTHRWYYYNAVFGDLIKDRPDLLEHYLNSNFKYGYNSGGGYIDNIPWEYQYPWWKPSLPLANNPQMPAFKMPWKYAFPSGHINATYFSGSVILLFLKNHNNQKINWKVKGLFIFWLGHILLMNFALIVLRFHWISDTAFTFVFSGAMIFIIHYLVNQIFQKNIL
ncbi:phosphatase PAP2 family protein [Spiroplasma chrysopicola]|uniref:Phosphatidic acid phosphatase type 2/haloperoxidase domain-containing protein n=1 Tax=Spiroplasma chrysopicola DF-1 TaxID=1276227 RepID=R4U165_9MOLU|nr:phosphatase PAP2 family protein [Spiroplasma chrysopicola]AGM25072.1 hypothetical protein SCHRY_v1c04940 [Spiroplasma chrysopicola DF-1]